MCRNFIKAHVSSFTFVSSQGMVEVLYTAFVWHGGDSEVPKCGGLLLTMVFVLWMDWFKPIWMEDNTWRNSCSSFVCCRDGLSLRIFARLCILSSNRWISWLTLDWICLVMASWFSWCYASDILIFKILNTQLISTYHSESDSKFSVRI